MKIGIVAGIAVAALALTGCGADDGQISDIASQAASAAASGVQSQDSEAVDALTGPVCEGLDQADQSLASLFDRNLSLAELNRAATPLEV